MAWVRPFPPYPLFPLFTLCALRALARQEGAASDDGCVLIVAVPTPLIDLTNREKFGPTLERILDREVKFVLTNYTGPAAAQRATNAASLGGAHLFTLRPRHE